MIEAVRGDVQYIRTAPGKSLYPACPPVTDACGTGTCLRQITGADGSGAENK